MSERWKTKPSVLSLRRLTARNILMKRQSVNYFSGKSVEADSKEPLIDSIWEWNKNAVEDIPHIS